MKSTCYIVGKGFGKGEKTNFIANWVAFVMEDNQEKITPQLFQKKNLFSRIYSLLRVQSTFLVDERSGKLYWRLETWLGGKDVSGEFHCNFRFHWFSKNPYFYRAPPSIFFSFCFFSIFGFVLFYHGIFRYKSLACILLPTLVRIVIYFAFFSLHFSPVSHLTREKKRRLYIVYRIFLFFTSI